MQRQLARRPGHPLPRSGIIEDQDTIQAIGGVRKLPIYQDVVAAWDYKAKRVVAALQDGNGPRLNPKPTEVSGFPKPS